MLLQAALNGAHTKADHAELPVTVQELMRDAVACVAVGASAIHLHPRDTGGRESLEPAVVDAVVRAVRSACGVPVGVSTGAWIEPNLERRLALISQRHAPDYASVNLSEPGAFEVMEALLTAGIGIEAGVATIDDAVRLGESGLGNHATRILIEVGTLEVGNSSEKALKLVDDIHRTLDRFELKVPRLQHGDGKVCWAVLSDAVRRGLDTRIGLEDTSSWPDGELTTGNEALMRVARGLGAG